MIGTWLKALSFRLDHALARRQQRVSAIGQQAALAAWRTMAANGAGYRRIHEAGFRAFSQHEEDGIILYLFALVETTNRVCIEMCCGDGRQCNTANLLVNHRWTGALFDGSESNVREARTFFSRHPDTGAWPPAIRNVWLTRENINHVIEEAGISGDIDLFSLDVDGNDLWFWEALETVRPRVIVAEINCLWGAERSVSTPYSDRFVARFTEHGSDYAGASLPAFVRVGQRKGYRLVGTNAIATNAFFVRDDILHPALPTVAADECFGHPRAQFARSQRLPGVSGMPWVEVP